MRFPDAVIEILRQAHWDPNAQRDFDLMSGGYEWSDEGFRDALSKCASADVDPFRCVLGYRASLVLGEPRAELREPWDQLLAVCPDWPGFRPERADPCLAKELNAQNEASLRQLERTATIYARAERIQEIGEQRNKKKWWHFWKKSV
jgi:hypothetical protein